MKKLIITIAVIVLGFTVSAQDGLSQYNQVSDLKAGLSNKSLLLTWKGDVSENTSTYWQVEGSADGKSFKTIGYVWGSEKGNCVFKNSIRKGLKYYRVLTVKSDNTAIASHTVKL
ncbi:MAG: hypothetical protein ABIY51_01795 [Ferruginibacter sp.]